MAVLRQNKGLQAAEHSSFSTFNCLQMQELPEGKDFESIFCRIDGANPNLPPDPEQVIPIVTIVRPFTPLPQLSVLCFASCRREPDFSSIYRGFCGSRNQP